MIYRIATALLLIAPSAWADLDRAGNIIDEGGGSVPAWAYIVLFIGLALWFAKEQSDKSTEEMRKRRDSNQALALKTKMLAEAEAKAQTLTSQISNMKLQVEKYERIQAVHKGFINGELNVVDYTEMVVRIVEPGFIEDFGPYKGAPTLE